MQEMHRKYPVSILEGNKFHLRKKEMKKKREIHTGKMGKTKTKKKKTERINEENILLKNLRVR